MSNEYVVIAHANPNRTVTGVYGPLGEDAAAEFASQIEQASPVSTVVWPLDTAAAEHWKANRAAAQDVDARSRAGWPGECPPWRHGDDCGCPEP